MQACVVHFGDHNVNVGVSYYTDEADYISMKERFLSAFSSGDLAQSLRLMENYFQDSQFTLKDMFRDQQREIVNNLLGRTMRSIKDQLEDTYRQNYPVMSYLAELDMVFPPVYRHVADYIQNRHIRKELRKEDMDIKKAVVAVEEAGKWSIPLDEDGIRKACNFGLNQLFDKCKNKPSDVTTLEKFYEFLISLKCFPFHIELGWLQNEFYLWYNEKKDSSFASRKNWSEVTSKIANFLKVRI